MFTLSVFLGAVVLLLITFKFFGRDVFTGGYCLPPGPKGNIVFGNLMELVSSSMIKGEAPFYKFANWAFEYGPICYVRFFRQRVVIISDAKVAQQLCVGQADKFSTRPPGLFLARVLKGKGIVFNDGPSWKEHRNFITQEFRKYGFGQLAIEHKIQYVVDEYVKQVAKTDGKPHSSHQNIATAIYNVIWTVISGDQFGWDDPFLEKLIVNLETNLQAVELTGSHNYVILLTLAHLLWHNPVRLLAIVGKRLTYFKQLISKYKKDRNEKTEAEIEESMIYDYLVKMQNASFNKEFTNFSESQLMWLVSDLFIAGGETTITTLRWSLLCLASFPDIQERVRKEISETFGQDSSPTYSQRTELPYMEAYIHEVLRFCSVTPGMWRNTTQDTKYKDYDIPKDTWVLLHFWAMSNNETQWEDGREFRPERFLNEDGTFRKNENLLAFSTGKRACPGEALARTELFLFTIGILQKFRIVFPPDQPKVDVRKGHFGVTYTPPHHHLQFIPLQTSKT